MKEIFQKCAAQVDGEPCCDWVGDEGAGHYVKMVHNGIEYGDMQLCCEAYHLMKVWQRWCSVSERERERGGKGRGKGGLRLTR